METAGASIRAKTKARGVRVERPPAPPSVPATPVRLVSIQQAAGNLAIQNLFDSGQRKSQEPSISPAMPAVAEGVSKESAIEQEQPKEPVTLGQTPATPEEDPAYQVVVQQLEVKAKRERTPTKTAKQKQDETLLAGNLTVEITSTEQAYREDLTKLAKVPQFTVDVFMEEFNQSIEKLAKTIPDKKGGPPQGYEAWDKKRKQTAGELEDGRPTVNQELTEHNKANSEPYRTPTVENVSDQVLKQNQALTSELKLDPVGSTPTLQQARTAAPKPKTEKAISLDEQSRALDDALVGHNVGGRTIDIDEASLAFPISGEKSFDEAGEAKRRAHQEILKAKPRYREQEKGAINKSEGEIHSLVNTAALAGHHARRSETFKGVLDRQEHHGGNIKKEKVTAFSTFETIYQKRKGDVDTALKKINPDAIEKKLTPVLIEAEAYFAASVRTRLEYIYTPGHLGLDYSDWIDENAADVATETERFKNAGEDDIPAYLKGRITVQDRSAAEFFQNAKTIFIGTVKRGVERDIAPMVVEALKEARNHIATGKAEVEKAYARLPEREKGEATQVFTAVQNKFQSLEESVVEAQHEVTNDMARTYNQSVGKLQSKFEEIKKDVLTSWLEKAWNKLKAIVNAIIEFATRIVELLGHIVGVVGDIISSPRAFFRNLANGIREGFSEFGRRIDEFLATAFFDWIRGKSGVQVQLPKEWNAAGIFSLFTQLLNLSTETIWQRMEVVYDTSVANAFRKGEVVLEKGLEIFDIVKREGLGGLWDHLVESLGTLLSDTLDEMKETVLYAAIKKVFVEIGKMLIPGGGFIAIAEKIIRLVVFIVEARNTIVDLIKAFVLSMENAVNGDIAGIVQRVTTALKEFITVALDFLVAFFGLSDLKEKVERFIERMRNPIIRAIDFVLKKFKPLVMKGKELVQKGREKVIEAGKAVVQVGLPEDPNERLKLAARASVSAASRLTGRVTQVLLNPILGGIKLRYGLTAIQPYEKSGTWWVRASINPDIDQDLGVPGEKADQEAVDVRDVANRALENELREGRTKEEAQSIVGKVAERLRSKGLKGLEIGPESEGVRTIYAYAEASEKQPLAKLAREASQEVPRRVSVRTEVEMKLAKAVTAPSGLFEATHTGVKPKGGISFTSSTGTELAMVSWNITALTSGEASDHAEDQVVKELSKDEYKGVLQNVETITLRNFNLSPCDDCCGELSMLLNKIRRAQGDNPKLKAAEIYWQELYTQQEKVSRHSATQTTWRGIRVLGSGRGWTIRASSKALPFEIGEIPEDIYKRYVYKRADTTATIKPAVELSTPSRGYVQKR
jgi:hypothetical protein